ncbi:unnamed protein product (mitochondrion) [Plasmodiophora brassicae]|uniref:Oxidoreductase n=1 Tax=Plasmodiophora brassicae TaxID=37360 RepID=A0A0G4IWT7_PLABS|nr:hypothetical protein PBRA_007527 [Plasmodiophora brassicae]SPR02115.1 unnamed protein product [Plasmodiophora brassicae]
MSATAMSASGNVVVVTGGGSGIGLALARQYLADGNQVIIVGRRAELLAQVAQAHPGLEWIRADIQTELGRTDLVAQVVAKYPKVNILVNNAGIQRQVDLQADRASWAEIESEIQINLSAPIHLSMLFVQHFQKKKEVPAAIVNVTSGLAFFPLASVPVYSSTKAALHSFTWSLRHQLLGTKIRVVEIAPPAVDTDLMAPGLHKFGMNVDEFADSVYGRVRKGEDEVGCSHAEDGLVAYRKQNRAAFDNVNKLHGLKS